MKFAMIMLLGFVACNEKKAEPELQEAKNRYLMISQGPTGSPKVLRAIDTQSIDNYVIWDSHDGTICEVTTHGDFTAQIDCTTDEGMATENAIDCNKGISKENPVVFFIGGVNKYNQNFYLWCEDKVGTPL